ncbi:ParB/RepB/Spo0J family partition protein [Actinocorallia sp. API 0066]|uniref:ParB/RepB/Spo0J family partition protein n=1 Tax=Actinocorallia sp. API 0066 TaxID=2896846 RepID=UPI001E2882BE|nr:ParB/RepB/Spo0J family partition protein [Actinocorallia sp. API 0066]MCD0452436.1 ParB/RepB/Spo0J family partition protein [Actinocorallia sp. API 0066]
MSASRQPRGLGKGLGALIPTAPVVTTPAPVPSSAPPAAASAVPGSSVLPELVPVAGARFAELPVASISPNPRQPRTHFDEEALEELATSISLVGLLQPVVVRELSPDTPFEPARYELIMGERRWRASQRADLPKIPAIIRETSDDDLLRDALLENLHRQQLNPLEEAAAYRQLLDDFGATHEQLAARIGRSRPHITNTLRLLNLPPAVQRRVAAGVLSAGHARALLGLSSQESMESLATRIVAEGLSVRAVEEIIALRDADTPAPAPTRASPRKPTAPGLEAIADRLSERYETKVRVDLGSRKGKIVVEFATLEDLSRILSTMAPDTDPPTTP